MTDLKECPFCGNAMSVRSGVNPMARCDTEGCWMRERHIGLSLDDPRQVASWNTRDQSLSERIAVLDGESPAETIGLLANRMLQLAPEASLYIGIKIEPARASLIKEGSDATK